MDKKNDCSRHSPDMNPLDLYHFGYMKDEIEKKNSVTISQMKEQVKEIIKSIPAEILQCVIGKFSRRILNCIEARAALFEN